MLRVDDIVMCRCISKEDLKHWRKVDKQTLTVKQLRKLGFTVEIGENKE